MQRNKKRFTKVIVQFKKYKETNENKHKSVVAGVFHEAKIRIFISILFDSLYSALSLSVFCERVHNF